MLRRRRGNRFRWCARVRSGRCGGRAECPPGQPVRYNGGNVDQDPGDRPVGEVAAGATGVGAGSDGSGSAPVCSATPWVVRRSGTRTIVRCVVPVRIGAENRVSAGGERSGPTARRGAAGGAADHRGRAVRPVWGEPPGGAGPCRCSRPDRPCAEVADRLRGGRPVHGPPFADP